MNINVSLVVQSLKLHQLRQSRQNLLDNDEYLAEEKEVQICRKALSDFRKQLRFFLHKDNIRAFEEHSSLLRSSNLSPCNCDENNGRNSREVILDVMDVPSADDVSKLGSRITTNNDSSGFLVRHRHKHRRFQPERMDNSVTGVGLTLAPISKSDSLSTRADTDGRDTSSSVDSSLRIRAHKKTSLPSFTESQLNSLSDNATSRFSGSNSYCTRGYNNYSPATTLLRSSQHKTKAGSPANIDSELERYHFADPAAGANSSFIQRLSELYCLQAETVRFEKLKAAKRRARPGNNS